MTYAPITKNGVEAAEPLQFADPPPPAFPHISLQTTVVDADGYTWLVTFNDTPLAEAAAVLRKRGCSPAGGALTSATPATPRETANDAPPLCPEHRARPMKAMKFADKQGHMWMCTYRYDSGEYCACRA